MLTDQAKTQPANDTRDSARREILEILHESGITPAQGVEGFMDRFVGRRTET